jgi:hypothetical protein
MFLRKGRCLVICSLWSFVRCKNLDMIFVGNKTNIWKYIVSSNAKVKLSPWHDMNLVLSLILKWFSRGPRLQDDDWRCNSNVSVRIFFAIADQRLSHLQVIIWLAPRHPKVTLPLCSIYMLVLCMFSYYY